MGYLGTRNQKVEVVFNYLTKNENSSVLGCYISNFNPLVILNMNL